jgi:hypothetical protein
MSLNLVYCITTVQSVVWSWLYLRGTPCGRWHGVFSFPLFFFLLFFYLLPPLEPPRAPPCRRGRRREKWKRKKGEKKERIIIMCHVVIYMSCHVGKTTVKWDFGPGWYNKPSLGTSIHTLQVRGPRWNLLTSLRTASAIYSKKKAILTKEFLFEKSYFLKGCHKYLVIIYPLLFFRTVPSQL